MIQTKDSRSFRAQHAHKIISCNRATEQFQGLDMYMQQLYPRLTSLTCRIFLPDLVSPHPVRPYEAVLNAKHAVSRGTDPRIREYRAVLPAHVMGLCQRRLK